MIPVMQSDITFKTGDCFSACIASILEVPLEKIPNFHFPKGSDFEDNVQEWCKTQSFALVSISNIEDDLLADCWIIATGKSPRGDEDWHRHAVVWRNGKVVHDPNPDRVGLEGEPETWSIFVQKDMKGGLR